MRGAVDLFHSKWWTIGWSIAVVAFFAHVAALSLLPLSLAQAVLSGGFVLLAVLAERYFGFSLGRPSQHGSHRSTHRIPGWFVQQPRRTGGVRVAAASRPPGAGAPAHNSRDPLQQYARDTWSSFVAMTDAESGLPANSLSADGTRSVQTSTTNIGAYMWSALVAERLGLITHARPLRASPRRSARSSTWSATSRAASSTTGTTTARARS